MDTKELADIARIVIRKGYSYEELKYSDYLYGKEYLADDAWDLVEECQQIGLTAFNEKYPL